MEPKRSRGQAAIEYMIVFGLALALSVPFIARAQDSLLEVRRDSQVVELQNSLDRLESASKTVNAAGAPARRTVSFQVPEVVSRTYMLDRAVVYTVETADTRNNVSRTFDFKVSGDIPENEGRHELSVSAVTGGVEVEAQ